jgi:hypothetical protein
VTGNRNTAIGTAALDVATADDNTAVGYTTLGNVTTGNRNTAIGAWAMDISNGSENTAIGYSSLGTQSGNQNTAVGVQALLQTTGIANTALGHRAGEDVTTGVDNILIGATVTGTAADTNMIRIGKPFNGLSGQNATFIAGIRGTTLSGSPEGVYIDAAGQLGSGPVVPASNTVGSAQVIADSLTAADLAAASVGTSEIADGAVSAAKVSFAFAGLGANVFQGTQQLGTGNLDLDFSSAAEGNITKRGTRFLHNPGIENTFIGLTSGNFTLTGGDNTGTGDSALVNLTSGARNTAVGSRAGESNTTGSDNIYLGAGVTGTADANTTRIGLPFNATTGVGQNKVFVAGISGTVLTTPAVQVFVDANGQLGTLVPPPITGTISSPLTPGAVEQRLAEQDKTIAELRARLARLEGLLAARPGRR